MSKRALSDEQFPEQKQRSTCPHCKRDFVVRSSGLLSNHRLPNKAQQDNGSYWCKGSDLKVGQ